MSYLAAPRLHFFGEFIAEPSTINNDPSNFSGPIQDPGWNPNGNHRFAFAATTVTSILKGGSLVTTGDPLIGGAVTTPGTPFAKLVDLDVDVQLASRIYGLQVQVADGAGNSVRGTMATANFRDFSGASFNRREARSFFSSLTAGCLRRNPNSSILPGGAGRH